MEAKEKILDCLRKSNLDLTAREICERTGLHRVTVEKWLEAMKAEKKVEITRKIGRARFYKAK